MTTTQVRDRSLACAVGEDDFCASPRCGCGCHLAYTQVNQEPKHYVMKLGYEMYLAMRGGKTRNQIEHFALSALFKHSELEQAGGSLARLFADAVAMNDYWSYDEFVDFVAANLSTYVKDKLILAHVDIGI